MSYGFKISFLEILPPKAFEKDTPKELGSFRASIFSAPICVPKSTMKYSFLLVYVDI